MMEAIYENRGHNHILPSTGFHSRPRAFHRSSNLLTVIVFHLILLLSFCYYLEISFVKSFSYMYILFIYVQIVLLVIHTTFIYLHLYWGTSHFCFIIILEQCRTTSCLLLYGISFYQAMISAVLEQG